MSYQDAYVTCRSCQEYKSHFLHECEGCLGPSGAFELCMCRCLSEEDRKLRKECPSCDGVCMDPSDNARFTKLAKMISYNAHKMGVAVSVKSMRHA